MMVGAGRIQLQPAPTQALPKPGEKRGSGVAYRCVMTLVSFYENVEPLTTTDCTGESRSRYQTLNTGQGASRTTA
jgi:hypothetical protein